MQAMRRRNGKQFGVLRHVVNLLAKWKNQRANNHHIEAMLQYHRKHPTQNKFEYDHTNSKWTDVNCVISIVTMSYNLTNVHALDRNDSE